MNILFLSRWFPYPPNNGSKIRIFNLLKSLAGEHSVTLVSFTEDTVEPACLQALQPYCQQVHPVKYRPFQPGRAKALLGFFSKRPRSVVDTFNLEMQAAVAQICTRTRFDAVVASQIDMAPYASQVPHAAKILEELELTTLYEQYVLETRPLKKFFARLRWWKLTGYLSEMLAGFKGVTVVSEPERRRLQQILPTCRAVEVIPNGVDTVFNTPGQAEPQPDTLIYSGALSYNANFDAVNYFLQEIFPLILASRPNVKFFVTGKLTGVPVEKLPKCDNLTFTGYLDDIRPKISQSWVNVVPLRLGGGTRLKVLESLALGTPVVATSKGAEGLDVVPGQDLLLADTPANFAAAVLQLLSAPHLRRQLSQNGRKVVEAQYGWEKIGQRLNTFITTVAE